jgi:hypothetical protein
MFNLRYHAVSLVAVFVALAIGIVVGVGLASRGSVSNPEREGFRRQIAERDDQIASLRRTLTALAQQDSSNDAFVKATLSTVMAGRLRAKRVVVVFVGPVDPAVAHDVSNALTEANALPAQPLRALKVPVDPQAIDRVLATRPAFVRYAGDAALPELGRALGQQLVLGGRTPLWNALSAQLVEERAGALDRAADAVVVVRSVPAQAGPTARFLRGFYAGLAVAGTPVVAAERFDASPSAAAAFSRIGVSVVDDVDTPSGRLALVELLAGGRVGGHYGLKKGADDVIPLPVDSVPPAPTGG